MHAPLAMLLLLRSFLPPPAGPSLSSLLAATAKPTDLRSLPLPARLRVCAACAAIASASASPLLLRSALPCRALAPLPNLRLLTAARRGWEVPCGEVRRSARMAPEEERSMVGGWRGAALACARTHACMWST